MASTIMRSTVLFGGRVQGVGFRYTVMNIAQSYDVVGYVRNMPDGKVELVAEGETSELNSLVEEVKHRMQGFIDDVTAAESPATGEFKRFGIQH